MNKLDFKYICLSLVDTFVLAGEKSLEIRKEGLKTEYKEDNTPVTNGDIEINEILINKIKNSCRGNIRGDDERD